MKKAEEYLRKIEIEDNNLYIDILKAVKQAQIDAVEEAVKRCANEPVYKVIGTHNQATNLVRKEILKIAEQLRKEIE